MYSCLDINACHLSFSEQITTIKESQDGSHEKIKLMEGGGVVYVYPDRPSVSLYDRHHFKEHPEWTAPPPSLRVISGERKGMKCVCNMFFL